MTNPRTNHRYTVELRIASEDLDPDRITRELGLNPTRSQAPTSRNDGRQIPGRWSYCGNSIPNAEPGEWDSLEDGLLSVMRELHPIRSQLAAYLDRYSVIWWCGHFQTSFDGGPTFSAELLKQLGDFGVPLFIDTYFSSE
ncbi:DUF4279 domain-containing protein [Tahibacter soli]|uniref:DUF4279 domain-containing protein n=1 Tax=Tahibacter soli TaxID=2983605 RepID=A0A9X4BJ12_9GAMM|nr:DUF4279 domain-containing protein [Tahibacter soli]MDC8015840.1 DUF4279 domain-containing protein [Tahibacter soli]